MCKKWYFVFLVFYVYSVIGWCYEVFLEVAVYRWGFSNRGFLFGAYCPVYGFGALLLLFFLRPLQKKRLRWHGVPLSPLLVFAGTMFLTTAVELLTSYILETFTGGWLWDYHTYAVQFDGRIALNPSIRFGLGGLLIVYGIQPLLEKAAARMGETFCRNAAFFLAALLLLDFCVIVIGRYI